MINIGVLGNGFIVPVFLEETKKIKGFNYVGIWGRNKEKLLPYQDSFQYITDDLDRILNDDKIDAVYVALPNSLHYEYGMKVLQHHKHLIMEKPFTVYLDQAKELIEYGKQHNLIVFEAMMTQHNPLYLKIKGILPLLGDIRIVESNFSQYSRRYNKFKEGIILPAFDKNLAGGALLDINVYNISFISGLFGLPSSLQYYPNVVKGIDCSGVLMMDYGCFKAIASASKDTMGQSFTMIQGDLGCIRVSTTSSRVGIVDLVLANGKHKHYELEDREFVSWQYEMKELKRLLNKNDLVKAQQYNQQTLIEVEVLDKALKSADLNY